MKKQKFLPRIIALTFASLLLTMTSCDEDDTSEDDGGGGNEETFSRSEMLTSMADGLIIPNLEALQVSVNDLSTAVSNFTTTTTEANLLAARAAWVEAVRDFQHTTAFGFGPGSLTLGAFPDVVGIFPVDEAQVEANLLNPDFNLAASFDRDVRGFYTVEYLIYGLDATDEEIVANFDQNRKDYLLLITDELESIFNDIAGEWNGSYRAEFIASDGTSAGSSTSLLYNEFVRDYENLKNFKVELPAGLTAGQEAPDPTLVEAYYSGISTELIELHFASSKNIWYGRDISGENLIGFEEYLESVEGGPELIAETIIAIEGIDGAIADLPAGRLADHVASQEVETLRDLLQDNTANFKSSMSSVLGISITFNSGDGD